MSRSLHWKIYFSLCWLKVGFGDERRWILYLLTFEYQENTLSPTFILGMYLVLAILAKNGIAKQVSTLVAFLRQV